MITVQIVVLVPIQKVWNYWTDPGHIVKWNFASEEWCCPKASNDLRVGGSFNYRMEAKDGSMGFDFNGTYSKVEITKQIEYNIEDGRKVEITFVKDGDKTNVIQKFEAETQNPAEMQKRGWQAIMNNFVKLVESKS